MRARLFSGFVSRPIVAAPPRATAPVPVDSAHTSETPGLVLRPGDVVAMGGDAYVVTRSGTGAPTVPAPITSGEFGARGGLRRKDGDSYVATAPHVAGWICILPPDSDLRAPDLSVFKLPLSVRDNGVIVAEIVEVQRRDDGSIWGRAVSAGDTVWSAVPDGSGTRVRADVNRAARIEAVKPGPNRLARRAEAARRRHA